MVDCALNIFTFTIPPALPAALTVGTFFAVLRLRKSGVFCIQPMRVNLGAHIKTFVFDKTGTLTEDSVSVYGFRPSIQQEGRISASVPVFTEFESDANALEPAALWWELPDT